VPQGPPYYTQDASRIESFFKQIGAGRVFIHTLVDADFRDSLSIASSTAKLHGALYDPLRVEQNARMFRARHMVMKDAIAAGYAYDAFLYLRDDNKFLVPFRQAMDSATAGVLPSRKPWIVVDDKCGYGIFPDKVYLADPSAARLLFSPNETEYRRFLGTWASASLCCKRKGKDNILQTEGFLAAYMRSAQFQVHVRSFYRTDFRYVKEHSALEGCRPYVYACCADPRAASEANVKTCPRPTKQRKKPTSEACIAQVASFMKQQKVEKKSEVFQPANETGLQKTRNGEKQAKSKIPTKEVSKGALQDIDSRIPRKKNETKILMKHELKSLGQEFESKNSKRNNASKSAVKQNESQKSRTPKQRSSR
jgi:hypothetical protein